MKAGDNDSIVYNQLLQLQFLLKKESSIKGLCKKKNICNKFNL